jgi:1,4-dihydroxy-2-naphthoate octaprenyltransferase
MSARATLLHLRFPFVYVLSPIFVWGAWRAPDPRSGRTTLGFLLVHLALYPGANAFNSAYDRDTGPIGGLARPPGVPPGLARASTLLQAAGAALAPLLGWTFAVAYVLLWGVFTAYSHPRTRWKRSPAASTAAIVLGQGGLGFVLGWSATAGAAPLDAAGVGALAVACAGVAAMYPLTQVYQLAADAARRDRTLAAVLGPAGVFLWAAAWFLVMAAAARRIPLPGVAAYAELAVIAFTACAALRPPWIPAHAHVMRIATLNSTVFLLLMLLRW